MMYNVDDNGRDLIQPVLFSTYCDMANMEQLSMCNTMSQALNKSSSLNNYKSIHDGVRRYSSNETGCKVEGDSHFKKLQGPEPSHRGSKSSKCRTTFYQISGLSLKKSIHPGEKTYNCSQYCKASNQSSELVQQWTVQNPQKE